ncbi:beta-lactamase [Herbaspirillum hiltneri N3]|uniref:Beta-lactamase n=2 Tax=Herbaspirillum TaxID=963 RepID=A0ABN4I306_9BURK|nr:beta-lactamase [Herbaspirillum hiltneri N3]
MYLIAALFAIGASLFVSETEARTLCTLIVDPASGKALVREGDCATRVTPASTFKIPIALMGYDAGFLKDEHAPAIPFREGYTYWGNPAWRDTIDPAAWIKYSVVWYSQQVTHALGAAKFKAYVDKFSYGNRDVHGDKDKNNALDRAWISSSIRISPDEQAQFLSKLVNRSLPVSVHAMEMTSRITLMPPLADGWELHGKTGAAMPRTPDGGYDKAHFYGWFIGWVTKDAKTRVIVRLAQEEKEEKISAGVRARDAFLAELPGLLD